MAQEPLASGLTACQPATRGKPLAATGAELGRAAGPKAAATALAAMIRGALTARTNNH